MKVLRTIKAIALVAVFMLTASAAFAEFEYKGYARSGVNYIGLDGTRAGAPIDGNAGRMGAENFYSEHQFVNTWMLDSGAWAKYAFQVALVNGTAGKFYDDDQKFQIRESYVEMGGFEMAKDVSFWMGKRYIRDDIHTMDWFYYERNSYGFGAKGIANMLDVNYLTSMNGQKSAAAGDNRRYTTHMVNVKAKVDALEINIDPYYSPSDSEAAVTEADLLGVLTRVSYKPNGFFFAGEGSSMVSLQYGRGYLACAPANWGMSPGNAFTAYDYMIPGSGDRAEGVAADATNGRQALRLVVTGLLQAGAINVNPTLWGQYVFANEDAASGVAQYYGAVIRTQFAANKNVSAGLDLGYVSSSQESGFDTGEYNTSTGIKITPYVLLQVDENYWTRPSIRLFYSYYMVGGEDAAGAEKFVGTSYTGSANAEETSTSMWGFMAEAWW